MSVMTDEDHCEAGCLAHRARGDDPRYRHEQEGQHERGVAPEEDDAMGAQADVERQCRPDEAQAGDSNEVDGRRRRGTTGHDQRE